MKRLFAYLKSVFLRGLLVVFPLTITFYVLWLIYRLIIRYMGRGSRFGHLITGLLRPTIGTEWLPGVGIFLTVFLVFLVGLVSRIYAGRKVYSLLDRFMGSTPVVSKMYLTFKQITNAILSRTSTTFREVVLFEYPRRGSYVVGFVTNIDLGGLEDLVGEDTVATFIFTTPNPLSGHTLFIPKKDLTYLDLTIEEGLRLVLSMGIVIPAQFLDNNVEVEDLDRVEGD